MSESRLAVTRRNLLLGMPLATTALSSLWSGDDLAAAQDAPGLPRLNRYPRMVHEYFVERIGAIRERQLQRFSALKSKKEATAYVQEVRGKIQQSFGPMPERTPLKARVTGIVQRDQYRIEKVIFESRPGFLVTANLYLPSGRGKFPGVVGTCGHSRNGKAERAYQSFAQGLARQGYAVLLYDPIGQGERLQYVDAQLKSTVGIGVREHLMGGNQQFLIGQFFGSWRAWDGIRALDYLLTRDEIDPRHLGVTGNSGGGTMTTWLCGVESRWTMAAPSCFVTSFQRNVENELPADTEQCPPRAIALGLDHFDFLAAMAPKPVIILAKEKDYFDARGAEFAYQRLRHLYSLFGQEQNISLFIGPTYHGYSQENREAMYRWFNRATEVSNVRKEPALKMEDDATLQCTPRGQVAAMGSRPIYSFTKDTSQQLGKQRAQTQQPLSQRIRKALKLPARQPAKPRDYRVLRARRDRKYPLPHALTYAVQVEKGIQIPVCRLFAERHYSRPPATKGQPVTLYVSHHSGDAELREASWLRKIVDSAAKRPFYSMDVRGTGESQPNTCGEDSFLQPYGCDYFYAIHALMLDDSYAAQKTRDVLSVLSWLRELGHRQIRLVANGWGTVPAVLASVLDDTVTAVTLKSPLDSFSRLAESREYDWPLSSFVPDVLKHFDLPECYKMLRSSKSLKVIA